MSKHNQRQLKDTIQSMQALKVLLQRVKDIVVSVRDGRVDFGITGWDVVSEVQATFPNAHVARDFDAFQVKRGKTVKFDLNNR